MLGSYLFPQILTRLLSVHDRWRPEAGPESFMIWPLVLYS